MAQSPARGNSGEFSAMGERLIEQCHMDMGHKLLFSLLPMGNSSNKSYC